MITLTANIEIIDENGETITGNIGYSVMQNLEANHSDRAYNDVPSYGIISNIGTLTFSDPSGEIKGYAKRKLLRPGLKVTIYLQNTLTSRKEIVGVFEVADWDYNNENKEVTLQLRDNLQELQEINTTGIDLHRYSNGTIKTEKIGYLLDELLKITPSKYSFLQNASSYANLDGLSTILPHFYLKEGTLWQQWTKLCEFLQAHIYKDFYGTTRITNADIANATITIPSKKIYDIGHKLPKTFIDKVEYKNTDLQASVDYVSLVETQSHDIPNLGSHDDNFISEPKVGYLDSISGSRTIACYLFFYTYYTTITCRISKYQNGKLFSILKLYDGKNETTGNNYIRYSVTYNRFAGEATYNRTEEDQTKALTKAYSNDSETFKGSIDNSIEMPFSVDGYDSVSVKISADTDDNTGTATFNLIDDETYEITLQLRVGNEYAELRTDSFGLWEGIPDIARGTCVKNVPISVEISFYGDIEKYETIEIPLNYGQGQDVYKTETNELLQSKSIRYYTKEVVDGKPNPYTLFWSRYTERNPLVITATRPDYYITVDGYANLQQGKTYTVSCKTSGAFGDTVDLFYAKNGNYVEDYKIKLGATSSTFECPETGTYRIRVDVNNQGDTRRFYDFSIVEGTEPQEYKLAAPVNDFNADHIISEYKDGKEVLELLCSIGEYEGTLRNKKTMVVTPTFNPSTQQYIRVETIVIAKNAKNIVVEKAPDTNENHISSSFSDSDYYPDTGVLRVRVVATAQVETKTNIYYEYDGTAISTKDEQLPMTFNIGNVVIPYKNTAHGDEPISLDENDAPKLFVVTGIDFIFDGAVWQRLILQEK